MRIVFDAEKLSDQGARAVDYDYPTTDVVAHLVGIIPEEREKMTDWEFDVLMQDLDVEQYHKEQEVIVSQMDYEQGLITMVCADENDLQTVQNELHHFNIPHSTDFSKCS